MKQNLRQSRLSWQQLSFEARLIIIGCIISAFVVVILSLVHYFVFRADRIPYVYDMELTKAKALEARLQAYLLKGSPAETMPIMQFQASPAELLIPRFPRDDEVFAALYKQAPVLLGRQDANNLWMRPLSDFSSFWQATDSFSYVLSASGLFIGSNRKELTKSPSGPRRREIDSFLRSGLASGTMLYTSETLGERIIAHRSVPGSNLIVFSETDLTSAFRPLLRYAYYTLFGTLLALWFVLMVTLYFIRQLLQPVRSIGQHLLDVFDGGAPRPWPHEFTDEFQAISTGITLIHQKLFETLAKANEEHALRSAYFDFIQAIDTCQSGQEVLFAFSQAWQKILGEASKVNLTVYLASDLRHLSETSRLIQTQLIQDGKTITKPESVTVDTADWRSRIEAAQQNQGLLLSTNGEEWLMLLRSRSSTQGFLLHSGLMLGQLGREKAIWIQILTQSCMQALMTSPYRVRESA